MNGNDAFVDRGESDELFRAITDHGQALIWAAGLDKGDLLLIEPADRLKHGMRETDTVARFGGDEFVVILNDLTSAKAESTLQAEIVAEKVRSALAEPYLLKIEGGSEPETTIKHQCTVSIGVVVFPSHDMSREGIFKWADSAMYQAKNAGRNLIRFYEFKA